MDHKLAFGKAQDGVAVMVIGNLNQARSGSVVAQNKVANGIVRRSKKCTVQAAFALGFWALSGFALARAEPVSAAPPDGWPALYGATLKPACARCHGIFKWRNAADVWSHLVKIGWIDSRRPGTSKLFIRLLKTPGVKPMPPPRGFNAGGRELAQIKALLHTLQRAN
jgi:hypothetical protein